MEVGATIFWSDRDAKEVIFLCDLMYLYVTIYTLLIFCKNVTVGHEKIHA